MAVNPVRSRVAIASQKHWINCHAIATDVPKPQVNALPLFWRF
ncbi:hypothetical protein [Cylindrospermopsis raciborskii]|nr:hypothetical protein [Cylindrospermopsis raciborskii]MCZ2207859.1 hypothetical protein [Cylindrospermopsis raciborskii PAMP2011]